MKKIIVIGSGISGLSAAVTAAKNASVLLISPYPSERSQSVMAAGGINGALNESVDSCALHAKETIDGGAGIADRQAVENLCDSAPGIIRMLDSMGTVFNRDENNNVALRAFGGQSVSRTAYAGACTGKQIVTALVRSARCLEVSGKIERRLGTYFLESLIDDSGCKGCILYDKHSGLIYSEPADAVILACGGQNTLFGKTTGSTICDGSAAAAAFRQGVSLRNLEMIQYHPTTIETPQKRMLISEAARGEGGRLFYLNDDNKRVYFMEDKYGERGNLMPRDIVSREIYESKRNVYLDVTFLGKELIDSRLHEIYELCMTYLNLDITKEPIPVAPSVHFFMGGIAVDRQHRTSIDNLYAVGECASMYHGANRLGGNSLLAAVYSGQIAAENALSSDSFNAINPDLQVKECKKRFDSAVSDNSKFPVVYLLNDLADIMNSSLGISRSGGRLKDGISDIDFYIRSARALKFDRYASPFDAYTACDRLFLAKAILLSALAREESRGAHFRSDFPQKDERFCFASYAKRYGDDIKIEFKKDALL